jgi:Zn-dependent peptidase ImmA (M78 family)
MSPVEAARLVFGKYATCIPVDVMTIAAAMGIQVRAIDSDIDTKFSHMCGVAYADDKGKRLILYNATLPEPRQRFTIAHELAHHVLGHTDAGFMFTDRNFAATDPKEMDANLFASTLLVPLEWLKKAATTDGRPTVSDLARVFKVSEHVICRRLELVYKQYL